MAQVKIGEAKLDDVLDILPSDIARFLRRQNDALQRLEEIRIRVGRPVRLTVGGEDRQLGVGRLIGSDEVAQIFKAASRHSVYMLDEELRRGFITLPGGHRVGLAGETVLESGLVKRLKHITAMNVRIAREVKGVAEQVAAGLIDRRQHRLYNTLIASPPGCGKTTFLRDLVRIASEGLARIGLAGRNVVLIDERSEVAACYRGVAQNDVGPRTDVLDNCPKEEGVQMAVRAMGAGLVAMDELGGRGDLAALEDLVRCGVGVLATAHASDVKDLKARPLLAPLMATGAFERIVVLSRGRGPGTVEQVVSLSPSGISSPQSA